jgi:S1-C subfamily serine protease
LLKNRRRARPAFSLALAIFTAFLPVFSICAPAAGAVETWEKLDRKLKSQVFQLNVGLKLRLKSGQYVQLADLSPRNHYPIFSTSPTDCGFKVIGYGTTFPIRTNRTDKTYFLTNRHVVDSGDEIIKECQRFYAATRLLAEQTAAGGDVERRLQELLAIFNLSTKKNMSGAERGLYQATADSVWDTYDTYLSVKADPARLLFDKYLSSAGVDPEIGYFLHPPGPVTQAPLQAHLYKSPQNDSTIDLAILTVNSANMPVMEFDHLPPAEGQEIQVIGYPTASDQIDLDSSKYYAPTFNTGRISRIAPRILQVDAPITTGNSGGPVVSQRGKVVGVVAVRALSARGGELPNFGGAITIQSVQAFAPELFERISTR